MTASAGVCGPAHLHSTTDRHDAARRNHGQRHRVVDPRNEIECRNHRRLKWACKCASVRTCFGTLRKNRIDARLRKHASFFNGRGCAYDDGWKSQRNSDSRSSPFWVSLRHRVNPFVVNGVLLYGPRVYIRFLCARVKSWTRERVQHDQGYSVRSWRYFTGSRLLASMPAALER